MTDILNQSDTHPVDLMRDHRIFFQLSVPESFHQTTRDCTVYITYIIALYHMKLFYQHDIQLLCVLLECSGKMHMRLFVLPGLHHLMPLQSFLVHVSLMSL